MATQQLTPDEQVLFDALPTTGEVDFDTFKQQLTVAGNQRVINRYHSMRRSGAIKVVLRKDTPDGELKSYISRPATA